jgi:hypothetical protein
MFNADKKVRGIWLGGQCCGNPLRSQNRAIPCALALAGAALFLSGVAPERAFAHNAPSGWAYPMACCYNVDCREVQASTVKEGPKGYVIRSTGEVIPMTDSRVKDSPDGEFHWCSVAGANNTRTICLFVPPRGF